MPGSGFDPQASDMKKEIDPVEQAVYETAHDYPGGARALAERMGLRPGTFNNKCDPAMTGHTVNLSEVRQMMRMTGDHRILLAVARELGYACVRVGDYSNVSDMELLNAWADWDAERGETVQAIRNALHDHAISEGEIERIRKEMYDDFQKELELLARLEGLKE